MTDEDFRQEVRTFIAQNLPPEMAARWKKMYHPYKPDVVFWTQKLNEKGWSVPGWAVEDGGPGWSVSKRHIFEEESFLAGCPALSPQGLTLVGPVIAHHGTQAQKDFHLPKIRSAEVMWAQGFSEPNAGSDLASLQCRAIRDGDEYVVNGQKIWTSEAHYSEWVFMLVRTSTEGKKQAGISFLLIDLATPGITIRPIISIDGGHELNEVFFEDVRVPAENLVGEENMGWTYAKELLAEDRTFSAEVKRHKGQLARIRNIARTVKVRGRPLIEDPHFQRRLAQLEIEVLAHEATLWRVVAEEEAGILGAAPTPSILKVRGTELVQRLGALMLEALEEAGLPYYAEHDYFLSTPEDPAGIPEAYGVSSDFMFRRSLTIYGGSNEVQRNIIAGQLLRK
jgi:alkylation response protein AidB-like acyl-CoA dehydrogenase